MIEIFYLQFSLQGTNLDRFLYKLILKKDVNKVSKRFQYMLLWYLKYFDSHELNLMIRLPVMKIILQKEREVEDFLWEIFQF